MKARFLVALVVVAAVSAVAITLMRPADEPRPVQPPYSAVPEIVPGPPSDPFPGTAAAEPGPGPDLLPPARGIPKAHYPVCIEDREGTFRSLAGCPGLGDEARL